MSMSTRDFIDLADRLANVELPEPVLDAILGFCAAQNPRFKRDLWLRYLRRECGPRGGPIATPPKGKGS